MVSLSVVVAKGLSHFAHCTTRLWSTTALSLQQFAYVLAVEPNIESMKTMWDLEKFSMRCSYLMQYWMDLDDYTGKFYLFHEGFLSVLFVPGDVWCIQSYGQNKIE